MEAQGGVIRRPKAEDVISKMKDEGDFDALRLKIIKNLKNNDNLRKRIVSEVKQSVALNQEGAENLKPRQLSDAIHQEIGKKIMDQISDELWKIIRSSDDDGMQNEIKEFVESVYNRLINPPQKEEKKITPVKDKSPIIQEEKASQQEASTCKGPGLCDSDPDLPPGFARQNNAHISNSKKEENHEKVHELRPSEKKLLKVKEEPQQNMDEHIDDKPPGFPLHVSDAIMLDADEDPDLPPGFG